jgi:hypothetical protein
MSGTDFTVGDLRRQLAYCSDDTKLTFGGGLMTFYRVKSWADDEVNIEFGEAQADLTPAFRKRNPHVKVAYINTDFANWDEEGQIGSISVTVD